MPETKLCPQCGTRYDEPHRFCTLDGAALVATGRRADLIGTVIADRYLVTAKLGDGGMGEVYLAEHVRMKRKCAVKVMRPGLMSDPDAISRFNREAENASQVSHANVAATYDFGETQDGLIYLAMEFIEGESLAKILDREKAIHPVRAAEIIRQAAEGLDVAHSLGILHRDLKPENIMVTRTREHLDMVKIVDFGIARAMSTESQRVTRTGSMVGTPEYMSPEQFAGDTLDARTDLYSLALVAFTMLTGAPAYPSGTSKDNLIVRLTQPPRRLREVRDLPWPTELQATFDKALASDPGARHSTVMDFSREMTAAIASMPASQTGEIYISALASALAARSAATPLRSHTPVDATPVANSGSSHAPPSYTPAESAPSSTGERDETAPGTPRERKRMSPAIAITAVIVLAAGAAYIGRSMTSEDAGTTSVADSANLVAAVDSSTVNATAAVDSPTAGGAATDSAAVEQQILARGRNSVFTIASSEASGLGFHVDQSGLVVTSSRVVGRDSTVSVQIDDTTRVRARVAFNDSVAQVAVLAISRSRCARCAVLSIPEADSAQSLAAGSNVYALGGVRPARTRLIRGTVTSTGPRSLRTSLRTDPAETGAPILSAAGEVVGVFAASAGNRELPAAEIRRALAAARRAVAAAGFTPPPDSLLPVRPLAPFPADPIATVAAVERLDRLDDYMARGGNTNVFVMTPPLMAWRDARARGAIAKLPAGPGAAPERIDPVQGWRGWDQCIRTRCAVVAINVVPELTRFPYYKTIGVENFARGNIRSITLLRDNVAVEPIEAAYFPAVLNVAEHESANRRVFSQGVVLFRAREFAPKPTGGLAKYELLIVDAAQARPVRIELSTRTIQTIVNDFAPYGLR